jgi:hypothetical protein
MGGHMTQKQKERDVTGVKLTPGNPGVCLGNGENDFECCCDECDFYLLCFPEFDPGKDNIHENKAYRG